MADLKKIMISIYGKQIDELGQEDEIRLITTGHYSTDKKGERHRIEYDETDVSGVEGTHTSIVVHKNQVSITRDGTTEGHMQLSAGKRYVSSFSTPAGVIELGFFPTKVDVDLSESEGKVDLEYQMDIDGTLLGVNRLKVEYRAN